MPKRSAHALLQSIGKIVDRAFVDILRCADGSLSVGLTRRSVEERVAEHDAGLVPGFTRRRRPVALIHSEAFARYDEAVATERRIKGWSLAKKIAYMRGDFEALSWLAQARAKKETPHSQPVEG